MKSVRWLRARWKVIENLRGNPDHYGPAPYPEQKGIEGRNLQVKALTQGFIGDKWPLEEAIESEIEEDDRPLEFVEVAGYSTWFAARPERIAGMEVIANSRQQPVKTKGSEEEVKQHFTQFINQMNDLHEKARRLAEKLRARKRGKTLGELAPRERNDHPALRAALAKSTERKKSGKTLEFAEVVQEYNKGITPEEIKAWVWYKRTLGVPMHGWEDYFLSGGGEKTTMLVTTTDTTIYANSWKPLRTAPKGTILGKKLDRVHDSGSVVYQLYRNAEGIRMVHKDHVRHLHSEKSFGDWEELEKLLRAGALFFLSGELVPFPVYGYGNMYDRELDLEKDREHIIAAWGEDVYLRHRKAVSDQKPRMLSVKNPAPNERPRITLIGDFAGEFEIEELGEGAGVALTESKSLRKAFKDWLYALDEEDFKESGGYEIWNVYVLRNRVDSKYDKEEREGIKARARNEGEELFQRFMHEALSEKDQNRLDLHWNRLYNGQSELPYLKIPVGFQASSKFKRFDFELRPAQREGVAFMNAVGSGIVAYDVGVGKTMTAIVAMAEAIHTGRAVRPLVVVPNPTYEKWIGEIIGKSEKDGTFVPGVLSHTGIELNDWYNLGKRTRNRVDLKNAVPERSITIVTYEGFKKIGFGDNIMREMAGELSNILEQSDAEPGARDAEVNYARYEEVVGVGIKNTEADIDTLGFDMLVIDEAHRCKNIFPSVETDRDGNKRFQIHGSTSETGIKAFFLCNYIQRRYNGNVMLLTATPFTNSPLEIFSMLSLVALHSMQEMGILKIRDFFYQFVQEETDLAVNVKGEVESKSIIKRFINRLILQRLIYNHISYKTGDEAGIIRPCKINLPRIKVLKEGRAYVLPPQDQAPTYLGMTGMQKSIQDDILELVGEATEKRFKKGLLFKALGMSLQNALSPFLVRGEPEDHRDFVESSPKIHYCVECIRSVKQYHEDRGEKLSGQVVYMNRGKSFFWMIKQYLEEEIGFKSGLKWGRVTVDEVETITSEMSASRKENVKEAFLNGVVKVIIGTATIREGIDLQKNSSVLYNLYPDWNPTDIRQLEGRVWRQGNRHGYVRVVMPLVQDSMDVFVFQKLEEKTARINDIWYRADRGNVLDLESLDPKDIKFALISDPAQIAAMKLKEELAFWNRKVGIQKKRIEKIRGLDTEVAEFHSAKKKVLELYDKWFWHLVLKEEVFDPHPEEWFKDKEPDTRKVHKSWIKTYRELEKLRAEGTESRKQILAVATAARGNKYLPGDKSHIELFKERNAKMRKTEKTLLEKEGLTIESDFSALLEKMEGELEATLNEYRRRQEPAYLEKLERDAEYYKSSMRVEGESVENRVEDFKRLNHLLDWSVSNTDTDNCDIPVEGTAPDKTDHEAHARVLAIALRLKMKMRRRNKKRKAQ